jgi:hypothetical protein
MVWGLPAVSAGNGAALNLLQLFDRFAKPVAAAAKSQTLAMPLPPPAGAMPRLMLVVETLDNLLQYQAEGNARVTYGLVRRQAALKRLLRPVSSLLLCQTLAACSSCSWSCYLPAPLSRTTRCPQRIQF